MPDHWIDYPASELYAGQEQAPRRRDAGCPVEPLLLHGNAAPQAFIRRLHEEYPTCVRLTIPGDAEAPCSSCSRMVVGVSPMPSQSSPAAKPRTRTTPPVEQAPQPKVSPATKHSWETGRW